MAKIITKKEITSTNTWAKENIDLLEDKSVVCAEKQTKGRGRFTRKWISDNSKNIYMSFVLKPNVKIDKLSSLPLANVTQYLSLCLAEILREYKIKSQIKWPNDVLVNNKKIAGILAELVIKKGEFKGLIVGIGINLDMTQEELKQIDKPATSLNFETEEKFNKEEIKEKLINKFFEKYDDFLENGFEMIREDYLHYFYLLNQNVKINLEFNFVEGKIKDVNKNGVLVVQNTEGEIKEISIGDIL